MGRIPRAGRRGGSEPADDTTRYDCRRMETIFEPICFTARVSRGTCGVIEVSGELDLAGAPLLASAVRDLDLARARHAVLDLRRLAFVDAAGLNAVLDLYAECLSVGTPLTIIPGPRSVQRLFELTRLDGVLPFCRP